jgi:hypothetical protein
MNELKEEQLKEYRKFKKENMEFPVTRKCGISCHN